MVDSSGLGKKVKPFCLKESFQDQIFQVGFVSHSIEGVEEENKKFLKYVCATGIVLHYNTPAYAGRLSVGYFTAMPVAIIKLSLLNCDISDFVGLRYHYQ